MMKLFFNIYKALRNEEDVVLVSIIADSGSTPRGTGAKMAVFKNSKAIGTIGGGAVEYKSVHLAVNALKEKQSYTQIFRLSPNDAADLGMICGGELEVYFQYIKSDSGNIELMENIIKQMGKDEISWLITEIYKDYWNMRIYSEGKYNKNNPSDFMKENENRCIVDPLVIPGKVYVFGGGHISQKLVPVLESIQFKCCVIDDKPEFANAVLFPKAEKTIVDDFSNLKKVNINPCDYIVILTRGHKNDYNVLVQALKTKACYIGLVGSRTKLEKTKELLFKEGFCEKDFKRIHAPIGIAIKAETPEEIAVSIAGEMIKVRADLNETEKQ